MLSIIGQAPAPSEKMVSPIEVITFTILETSDTLDLATTKIIINDELCFSNGEFLVDFSESTYERVDETINFEIINSSAYKLGKTVNVKIVARTLEGTKYSFDYLFKIIPSEPVLISSNPTDEKIFSGEQVIFFHFEDIINDVNVSSIKLYLNDKMILSAGEFDQSFCSVDSEIEKVDDGAKVTIYTKYPIKDGKYIIKYIVADLSGNLLIDDIKFTVKAHIPVLPDSFTQIVYENDTRGLRRVQNLGTLDSLLLEWEDIHPRVNRGDAYFVVYQTLNRYSIFDEEPKYLARVPKYGIINELTPNETYSFAGRAFEVYRSSFSPIGMTEHNEYFYLIPEAVSLTNVIIESSLIIPVNSTAGYPEKGILIINNSEVIRYSSKTETQFIIQAGHRGLAGTSPTNFLDGDEVKLYFGCQDRNENIVIGTPTAVDGYQTDRMVNQIGVLTPNYDDEERKFFQGFDFCGYHQALPQKTLQGIDDCGSYLGGEFNKLRGFNLYDQMVGREEMLINQSGEPVLLLRRIWNGNTCSCSDARKQNPKVRTCHYCFGTGFRGGYEQYQYRRKVDGRIMVKFGDTVEDLKLGSQHHMQVEYEPSCWTLPNPAVRDRDLIVRFDYTNDIEYIYEVLDVTKEKLVFRHFTRQRLRLKRLDKTDVAYTFPIDYTLIRRFGEYLA